MIYKTFQIKTLLVVSFILYGVLGFSQNAQTNLQKYWKYRERLRNYVVVGDCQGCSLPAKDRSGDGIFGWTDETITLGHYIGMLAMEYKLLEGRGQNLQQITEDLYYAVEAFNRLDYMAEFYYGSSPSLNGFFIRDDVPVDFFDKIYKGERIENYLNKGLAPPPNGWKVATVASGFVDGDNVAGLDGPIEESQDQVIQLYLGFALVTKYVNPNAQYSIPFKDGEFSIVQEIKNISQRIINHMEINDWFIRNPAHNNDCVAGVSTFNDRNCANTDNGAFAGLLSYGFAAANCYIQGGGNNSCITGLGLSNSNKALWDSYYKTTAPGNGQDFKVLTLAAIGDVWGASTGQIIAERCGAVYSEHLPLVYQALHGGNSVYPNIAYECMLNAAPCFGNNGRDGNYEWSGGERILYGPNVGEGSSSSEWSGIDYLFYFNIFNLLNPGYLATNYKAIRAKDLCPKDLFLYNYTEEDAKNIIASNTISCGYYRSNQDNYTIQNDPDDFPSPTTVNLIAGGQINLLPGFTAVSGVNFTASIDPSLKPMECTNDGVNTVCTLCKTSGNEEQSNTSNYGKYKIYPATANEIYAATPHYLFKINNLGGTGDNMFAIDENNSGQYISIGSYLIGYQHFDNEISDVDYVNGNTTIVSFTNGSMLKINGTGGTGENMFAVTENSSSSVNAFTGMSGYSYYLGDQKFSSGVTKVAYINGRLLIGLSNGKMLKINGTGGSGHNMFAVSENTNSSVNAFTGLSGYSYYVGDQKFGSSISVIESVGSYTIIGLLSGKTLKINGTGGTGNNMFAITENSDSSPDAFTGMSGYSYYVGDQKFSSAIINITTVPGSTFVCFSNGKILKLNSGIGGTGHRMFAVVENTNSFSNYQSYPYYSGDDKFSSIVNDIAYINNSTLIGFSNGKILKVQTSGGTGNTMFNAIEINRGFGVRDVNFNNYIQGSMDFKVAVTQIKSIGEKTFVCLGNGKMLKLEGEGGTGFNMYGIVNDGCMKQNCGYYYLSGCQNFEKINAKSLSDEMETNNDSIPIPETFNNNANITITPNPNNGKFELMVKNNNYQPAIAIHILVYGAFGNLVYEYMSYENKVVQIDISSEPKGIYFVKVENERFVKVEKIINQ